MSTRIQEFADRRWTLAMRTFVGVVGLAITAASWFTIMILLSFWRESSDFPNPFVSFAGTWGLVLLAMGVSIYWIVRCVTGARWRPGDGLLLVLPASCLVLYLVLQGFI
ncbi:hypothetical protein HNR46_000117 [Haloferula luteola]|uniref:Uncharacterized protein n=1 Tax=Haloferula luteola TaxID=595692 RepID=A0A840UYJ3_9BACT|nr:hypothetical protein [Haloferula luteola]MBB5349896.1 hypothetical protein [Haloferula luteola]